MTSERRSSSRSRRASPRPLSARRFGVDRATLKRYCERPDERGTLEPRKKSPGQETQAGCEKARKLLLEDLRERPWATHSQRAEFLFATCGVSVSEASVCRMLGRLSLSHTVEKKDEGSSRTRRVLEDPLARGARQHRCRAIGVLKMRLWAPTPPWLPSTLTPRR